METKKQDKTLEVLVIEDNPYNAEVAENTYRARGINVDVARDYDEAVSHLDNKTYDGIVSDLLFPKKTGSNDRTPGFDVGYALLNRMHKEKDKNNPLIPREYLEEGVVLAREYEDILTETGLLEDYLYAARVNGIALGGKARMLKDFLLWPIRDNEITEKVGEEKANHYIVRNNKLTEKIENLREKLKEKNWSNHTPVFQDIAVGMASENEAHQMLGLKIGDLAQQKNIPYVIFTDAHSHSTELEGGYGMSAVDYATPYPVDEIQKDTVETMIERNVPLVFCKDAGGKEKPENWNKLLDYVLNKNKTQKKILELEEELEEVQYLEPEENLEEVQYLEPEGERERVEERPREIQENRRWREKLNLFLYQINPFSKYEK